MARLLLPLLPATTATRLPTPSPRRARVAFEEAVVVRCARAGGADGGRAGSADGGRAGSADDYHATLRALNSKGARRTPRKSLGQHYMLNSSINEQLSSIAEIKEGDVVLEIGPGTGCLTNVLIDAGATVVAVEKDPRMAALARDRFEGVDQFMILQEDFTKCHIRSYISHLLESKKSMGTDIEYAKDETALRLVDSSIRTSEYRPINVFVHFYSDAEYRFKVERTNFFPQPSVDAAVVAFKLKRTADYPEVVSIKGFFSMVSSAFNGKRKMLRNSLQHLYTSLKIEEALRNAGLPVTSRPEELTLDDFVRLHNLLARSPQISSSN